MLGCPVGSGTHRSVLMSLVSGFDSSGNHLALHRKKVCVADFMLPESEPFLQDGMHVPFPGHRVLLGEGSED